MKCSKCGRQVDESDIIIAQVRSEIGTKKPDGTVEYPMLWKKFCWRCVPQVREGIS